MKLKDVLHYYLPVRVELNNGGSKVYNRVAVAVGNMDDEYRYVTLRVGNGAKAFTHSIFLSEEDRIKPTLRPLSDMTEKEHEEWKAIRYNDGYHIMPLYTDNHYNAFHWLLSKHFDLFGLIESGQAIDATKMLNSEQNVQVSDTTEADQGTEAGNQKFKLGI